MSTSGRPHSPSTCLIVNLSTTLSQASVSSPKSSNEPQKLSQPLPPSPNQEGSLAFSATLNNSSFLKNNGEGIMANMIFESYVGGLQKVRRLEG